MDEQKSLKALSADDAGRELADLLETEAQEAGIELKASGDEIARFVSERTQHLADIFGQPGYAEAVRAERDNVVLFAAREAIENADAVDQRIYSVVNGAISIAARLVAGIPA